MKDVLAAAKINGLELEIPPFEYGEMTGTPGRYTARTPEYRAKFPRGQAPGFEKLPASDGSGGFTLAESGAIAHYISASGPKAAQLLGATLEEQGKVQEWIFWLELGPGRILPDLIAWRWGTSSDYDARKEEFAAKLLDEHLGYLEDTLRDGRKWLVAAGGSNGSGPSLADLTVGSSLLFACRFYIDRKMRESLPQITAYLARLREVEGLEELFTVDMVEERKQPPPTQS
ncbi:hypothetical protein SLS62_003855 [Diatrype stigma]|uniref:Glutathione S-transferase n=1 Tax=Diatrype stigma TaxID=117547 RepID=A0AAN9UVJ0_9PEZI